MRRKRKHKRSRFHFELQSERPEYLEHMIETIPWWNGEGKKYNDITYKRGWILEQSWDSRWLAVCPGCSPWESRPHRPATCHGFDKIGDARRWLREEWISNVKATEAGGGPA